MRPPRLLSVGLSRAWPPSYLTHQLAFTGDHRGHVSIFISICWNLGLALGGELLYLLFLFAKWKVFFGIGFVRICLWIVKWTSLTAALLHGTVKWLVFIIIKWLGELKHQIHGFGQNLTRSEAIIFF